MCRDCLHELRPERGRTCLDNGAYILNLKKCHKCGGSDIDVKDKTEEETDDRERVEFSHVCSCGHLIARHYYECETDEIFMEDTMDCALCGRGNVRRPFNPNYGVVPSEGVDAVMAAAIANDSEGASGHGAGAGAEGVSREGGVGLGWPPLPAGLVDTSNLSAAIQNVAHSAISDAKDNNEQQGVDEAEWSDD